MTRFGKGVGRVLSVLLLLGLVVIVIAALVVAAVMVWLGGLPTAAFDLLPLGGTADVARVAFGTAGGRAMLATVMLESLLVAGVVVVMLRRLLRSAIQGAPFVAANVTRLRIIAAAYAVSLAARFLLPLAAPDAIAAWLASSNWSYNLGDLGPLMVALVLAEVFREGIRLREDADMTI